MNKGLVILAKLNSTERMIVFVNPKVADIPAMVNKKYGESWVVVNELCSGDTLTFNSNEAYKGFDGRDDDNYCVGNLNINAFKSEDIILKR